ncbi:hypothetical protein CROQUDRAFT_660414 [Cronartium quercuum f. sp. fusiforme G11]|uniref:DUF676 domain-containing protein n=1 Tax=Cronartium quercuum f. sp. fusiforme G11 TaxID=708437 RepID=A0A9P6T9F4_9BASI|nr:hypothetical protein CROQUDRAFT_660414 [Cronartium quercuum f. sp. fusiforme G11]
MSIPIHLVCVIHGLWGTPEHVAWLADTLAQRGSREVELEVFRPTQIQWTNTYDGIDFCAELVAKELDQKIQGFRLDGRQVTKFSCVGYSLGGLISRFLIGLLHSRTPSFFSQIEPVNFATFASPWVGIPHLSGFVGSTVHFFGSRSLSRTGSQLYLADRYHTYPNAPAHAQKYPLVALLAHPDTSFYKALLLFKQLRIYANAVNDRTVPFVTGAAEPVDVFYLAQRAAKKYLKSHSELGDSELDGLQMLGLGGLEITLDPEYSPLIQSCTYTQDRIPSSSLLSSLPPPVKKGILQYLPTPPFFFKPSTYPFKAPYNYLTAIVSPVIIPAFMCYVLGSFYLQSHKSKQRIKKYSVGELGDHSRRLKRVGLLEVMEQDMIEQLAGLGNEDLGAMSPTRQKFHGADLIQLGDGTSDDPLMAGTPTSEYQDQRVGLPTGERGTQFSIALSDEKTAWKLPKITKARGLSALQLEMLENINHIPGLVKHFAIFHSIQNSHGAIIFRAGMSDPGGKRIVKHWVDHFIV